MFVSDFLLSHANFKNTFVILVIIILCCFERLLYENISSIYIHRYMYMSMYKEHEKVSRWFLLDNTLKRQSMSRDSDMVLNVRCKLIFLIFSSFSVLLIMYVHGYLMRTISDWHLHDTYSIRVTLRHFSH